MKFEFSIRKTIKESWEIFKSTPWFFIGLTVLSVVINMAGGEKIPWPVTLLGFIASIIMSYVWLSVALAAVDGKTDMLHFKRFASHLPTIRAFLVFFGIWITSGVFITLGFIALIIPGFYFLTRLVFAETAYVDRKGGVMQSLRYSWHMVKGDVFWTVFLTGLVSIGLILLGVLLIGVGLLVMYPVAALLMARLYRTLSLHHAEQAIVVQPEELVAPTPVTE